MSISGGRPDRPAMADFEVHIDLDGRTRQIGLARSNRVRGRETIVFGYDDAWLEDPDRFLAGACACAGTRRLPAARWLRDLRIHWRFGAR